MYQVVGFVAAGAAGAALLHSWNVPKFVSFSFLSLNLFAAGLVGLAQTMPIKSTPEPIPFNIVSEMPPAESFVAPPRPLKPATEIPVW